MIVNVMLMVTTLLMNVNALVALLERPAMSIPLGTSRMVHSEFELDTVLGVQRTASIVTSFLQKARQEQPAMRVALSMLDPSDLAPQIHDKETVLNFAKMYSNAYVMRSMHQWRPLPSYEEDLDDFGWE